jgi:hypothetical protein
MTVCFRVAVFLFPTGEPSCAVNFKRGKWCGCCDKAAHLKTSFSNKRRPENFAIEPHHSLELPGPATDCK